MRGRWLSTVLVGGMLALSLCHPVVSAAVGDNCTQIGTLSRSPTLVSYRQEGGIGGPRPSLVVSREHGATVTSGRCTAKFGLQLGAWNRLRAALREADMHAIAGSYPPPKGSADEITYVIKAGRDTVRIAPAPQPEYEEVMRHLRPLLKVLNKTVSIGEQRMSPACKSNSARRDDEL